MKSTPPRSDAAAILTGVRHARTELVASIDCDCTYDPHELARMIPLMADDVDVVTASPYHPDGQVRNVPGWRLLLSKGSSFLYRRVLRQKLHTYTSCFRLYRRSAVADVELREGGFLGVAELLGRLDLRGSRVGIGLGGLRHAVGRDVGIHNDAAAGLTGPDDDHSELVPKLGQMTPIASGNLNVEYGHGSPSVARRIARTQLR